MSFAHRRKKKHHAESTAVVFPLLPPEAPDPEAEEEDLENFHVVSSAIAEAESFQDGSAVYVEEDIALAKDAVHLEGGHGRTPQQFPFNASPFVSYAPPPLH